MSGATSLLHEFAIDKNFIMHQSPHVYLIKKIIIIGIVENICLPSYVFGRHIKIEMMESKLLVSLLLSGMTVKWRDDFVISSPTHFSSHFLPNSFYFPFFILFFYTY